MREHTAEVIDLRHKTREHRLFRFKNNYGASTVRLPNGNWDVMIINFTGPRPHDWHAIDMPKILKNEPQNLTEQEIDTLLAKIEELPSDDRYNMVVNTKKVIFN